MAGKEFQMDYSQIPFKLDMKRIRKLTEDAERDMRRQRKLIQKEIAKENKGQK